MSMAGVVVSVNICCYQSERFFAATLDSVLGQSFRDLEVVIVDDGSSDRTAEIVRGFGDPRIRYFFQENRGLAASRNRAASLSRGRYLAFQDHDDLWLEEKLAEQVALLEARADVGLVYSDADWIDAEGRILRRGAPDYRSASGSCFEPLLLGSNFVPWQSVVVRRSVWERVGEFRPYRIVEDYDWLLRCARAHHFASIDHALIEYRQHDHNVSMAGRQEDPGHVRKAIEGLREALDVKERWSAILPPGTPIFLALARGLGDVHYDLGRQLCVAGELREGLEHLRHARRLSNRRSRAWVASLLARALGERLYPRLVGLKRGLAIPK
jgi:glycosyltransferase involved in cell wall biosynthesis